MNKADQTYREQEERQKTDANDPSKLTDDTWQAIRDQWETGASDASLAMRYFLSLQAIERHAAAHQWQRADAPEGVSRGAPGRSPILDRPQLMVKHQAEWAALDAIQADVVAAFQGIRTELQARATGALPGRPNRTSANGAQNRAQDSDPRGTLDDVLKRAATWAALYQKAASGLQKAQHGERRAHGFDFRMPQQQTAEDPETIQSRIEVIDAAAGVCRSGEMDPRRAGRTSKSQRGGGARRLTAASRRPAPTHHRSPRCGRCRRVRRGNSLEI